MRHNNLRVTRILKCLGLFGFHFHQMAWIDFLTEEIFKTKALAKLEPSMSGYWIHTIRNDEARKRAITQVHELIKQDEQSRSAT